MLIAYDTETFLFAPGLAVPPLVCMSLAWRPEHGTIPPLPPGCIYRPGKLSTALVPACEAPAYFAALVAAGHTLIAHNAAFDSAVMCQAAYEQGLTLFNGAYETVFDWYRAGALRCTFVREKLLAIAYDINKYDPRLNKKDPGFSLADCVKARFGIELAKGSDTWRLRYDQLWDLPLAEWPPEAVDYAIWDAEWALCVYEDQSQAARLGTSVLVDEAGNVTDELPQGIAAFALFLCAAWGVCTDPAAVDAFEAEHRAIYEAGQAKALELGFLAYRPLTSKERAEGEPGLVCTAPPQYRMALPSDTAGARWRKTRTGTYSKLTAKERAAGEAGLVCVNPGQYRDPTPEDPPGVRYTACKDMAKMRALVLEGFAAQVADVWGTAEEQEAELRELMADHWTKGGQIGTSEETLTASGHPGLVAYAESLSSAKLIETYLPILRAGTIHPITSGPRVLVATGRTAWSKPNLQNPPKKGGFRECFKAREGMVFCSVDYSQIELCTLSQVEYWLFGRSAMRDAINSGKDLHTAFAADMEGETYEIALAKYKAKQPPYAAHGDSPGTRFTAKGVNFGAPGGMGAKRLKEHLAAQEPPVIRTLAECKRYLAIWRKTWPEKADFFAFISNKTNGGEFTLVQPVSGRLRGGTGYCDGCNSYFQGLAADGVKAALVELVEACYTGVLADDVLAAIEPHLPYEEALEHGTPATAAKYLANVRPWVMIHDEIIAEGPEETAHVWGPVMAALMVCVMRRYTPDVKIKAEPALMRVWDKGADAVYDAAGKLLVWERK